MNTEEWLTANAEQAAKALLRASSDLYALLGGEANREWQREELAEELRHLELTWRYPSS